MAASLRIWLLFAFLFLTFTVKIFTESEDFLPCEGFLSSAGGYVRHRCLPILSTPAPRRTGACLIVSPSLLAGSRTLCGTPTPCRCGVSQRPIPDAGAADGCGLGASFLWPQFPFPTGRAEIPAGTVSHDRLPLIVSVMRKQILDQPNALHVLLQVCLIHLCPTERRASPALGVYLNHRYLPCHT